MEMPFFVAAAERGPRPAERDITRLCYGQLRLCLVRRRPWHPCYAWAMEGDDETEAVLEYWFGRLEGELDFPNDRKALWWGGGEEVDREIDRRFGPLVEKALAGELSDWKRSARGRLAFILLLDQFQRSLGRGTPRAFAGDPQALAACLEGIDCGHDRELRPIERSFFYMPLVHTEDERIARRCLSLFSALSEEIERRCPEGHPDFLTHAKMHADIVLRFGRFPHRNEILGRRSTTEEASFLSEGGPRFGQKKR